MAARRAQRLPARLRACTWRCPTCPAASSSRPPTATTSTASRSRPAADGPTPTTWSSDTRMQIRLARPLAPHGVARLHLALPLHDPGQGRRPHRVGAVAARRHLRPRATGTRGWRSSTTSAAGTRCPTSAASSTWSTATSTTRSRCRPTCSSPARASWSTRDEVLTAAERARLAEARTSDATVTIRGRLDVTAAAAAPSAGRRDDLALPHAPDPRRRVRRVAGVRVGRRAHRPARRQDRARDVVLPGARPPRPTGWTLIHRVRQGGDRGLLAPLVPVSLAGRGRDRRAGRRHGVPGHRLRRRRRSGQDPVLPDRARVRPQPGSR